MPLPTVFVNDFPCLHAIPADADQCYCGLRQAWPRQLELFTWAELHPVMAEFMVKHLARYKDL